MSIHSKIAKLRQKPQHVRERILLVSIAVAAPILLTIWFATFSTGFRTSGNSFVKDIFGGFSKTFNL
jgi:hypothetical protein